MWASLDSPVIELPVRTDNRSLRVLVVTESFLPQVNGVTNSVRRVLDHLAERGHEAAVIAPSGPREYAGFPVMTTRGAALPMYRDFRIGFETQRRLRTAMFRFRPDVVHVASPAALGLQAIVAAGELGVPTVAIYQTDLVGFAERYAIPGSKAMMGHLTRAIHTRVDRTLAPSSASLRQLDELAVDQTYLWPRGVDLDGFHPSRRDAQLRSGWASADQVVVGYVGRLAAEKELELLAPLDADPRYQLVMVGGGPEEGRLQRTLPNAHFTGTLHGANLGAAFASFDVFAHTGRHETFCQSAQEALASGVPVVAPRSGGPLDLVADGHNGSLFTPGDSGELAAHVRRLGTDVLLRHRMSQAARRSVEGRSWATINDALIDHYREVHGRHVVAQRLAG